MFDTGLFGKAQGRLVEKWLWHCCECGGMVHRIGDFALSESGLEDHIVKAHGLPRAVVKKAMLEAKQKGLELRLRQIGAELASLEIKAHA